MKFLYLLLIVFLSNISISQNSLVPGKYLTSNNLICIEIKENNEFYFYAFKDKSPYTEKKKKRRKKNQMCNISAYYVDMHGKGNYIIKNGEVFLIFDIDLQNTPKKYIDTRMVSGMSFKTEELVKI